MPRPSDCERTFEGDAARHGFAEIVLASPLGLVMVAIIAAGSLTAMAPSSTAETARVAAAPFDLDIGAARRSAPRTVTAEELQALVSDPAVKSHKGLAEYAWDFTDPKEMPPGFGPPYPTGDQSAQ